MSRLWDTPEYWARTEADELLRRHPDLAPAALADSIEHETSAYDADPQFARDIVDELCKRADAAVRFWPEVPELPAIEAEVRVMLAYSAADRSNDGLGDFEAPDAPSYWWQRM